MNTTDATLALVADLAAKYQWLQEDGFVHITLSDYVDVTFFVNSRSQVATIIRELRGKWSKNDPGVGGYDANRATWTQRRVADRAITYKIVIDRAEVCTRVEVGRHTELVEVPTGTRTESREVVDYEWHCTPVLGGVS